MEDYMGQWITLYNKHGYDKIIGYVIKVDDTKKTVLLKITHPKKIRGKTVVVELEEDFYTVNDIDVGMLTTEDKKFLIDVALMFRDKEWFMELTKGVMK